MVPREQFIAWGRAVLCRAKRVIPHPEVPPATKANLRVSLCFKAWSGLWILEQTNPQVQPQHQIRYEALDMVFFSI